MENLHQSSPPLLSAPSGENIPKWDTSTLEKRDCIVCGCNDYKVVCYRPDRLEVGQCVCCSAFYLPAVPGEDELLTYYKSYSRTKGYMQERPLLVGKPSEKTKIGMMRRKLRGTRVGERIHRILRRQRPVVVSEICELLVRTGGIEGKHILEIGPGISGGILQEVAGWGGQGIAIEIDPISSKAISDRGVKVFSDISEMTCKADVIYASMVLEHLKDPALFLKRLSAVCTQGGRIIVRVPNAGQVIQRGANWIGFRVDLEHLNFFDQQSLNTLLFQSGFNTECVWLSAQPILPEYLGMADRNRFLEFAQSVFRERVRCYQDILTGSGDFMLSILARKDV